MEKLKLKKYAEKMMNIKSNPKLLTSILSMGAFNFHVLTSAQVGIGTASPAATLDVVGKPSETDKVDGIIAPKITGDQLVAKDAIYNSGQSGTIVYVTSIPSVLSVKTANVSCKNGQCFKCRILLF